MYPTQASLASSSRHHDDLMADREALLARLRAERGAAEQDASEARREANVLRTQLDSAEEETHRLKVGVVRALRACVCLLTSLHVVTACVCVVRRHMGVRCVRCVRLFHVSAG